MDPTASKGEKSPARIAAGRASQQPEILALRIVRNWSGMNADQQSNTRHILRPIMDECSAIGRGDG
jgi:hypothetical protein